MATSEEIEEFLDAYTSSWEPDRDWSKKIFHPNGGVRYAGSNEPVNPDTPPSMTDQIRLVAPDLRVRLVSWAGRGDILFAEWELTCTFQGRPFKLVAVNRFHLEGNKARDAEAFIDRMSLMEFVDPTRPRVTLRSLLIQAATGSHARGDGAG